MKKIDKLIMNALDKVRWQQVVTWKSLEDQCKRLDTATVSVIKASLVEVCNSKSAKGHLEVMRCFWFNLSVSRTNIQLQVRVCSKRMANGWSPSTDLRLTIDLSLSLSLFLFLLLPIQVKLLNFCQLAAHLSASLPVIRSFFRSFVGLLCRLHL